MAKKDLVDFLYGAESRHPENFFGNYDTKTSRYNPDYVNPSHWTVRANAWNGLMRYITDKNPDFQALMIDPAESLLNPQIVGGLDPTPLPEEIVAYEWKIVKTDGSFEKKHIKDLGTASVITFVDFQVPTLGKYQISLVVRFKDGSTETGINNLELRDFLVVSIGDSFSSGEGNPDKAGQPTFFGNTKCELTTLAKASDASIGMLHKAEWQEEKAHRSYSSAPSHATRILTNNRRDPGDMFTFLSFARSGSEIINGLVGPIDETIGVGQIDEIKRAIGNKKIDFLLISIGGNDVGFSTVLENIVKGDTNIGFFTPPFLWIGDDKLNRDEVIAAVNNKIATLKNLFLSLNPHIDLLNVARDRVFFLEYPVAMFDKMDANGVPFVDKGCGLFDGPDLDVSKADAIAIQDAGMALLGAIQVAVATHKWRYIGGITDAFAGHGYCAEDSYFVSAEDSCKTQGDFRGIMHPTGEGVVKAATLIANKINRVIHPIKDTIRIERGNDTTTQEENGGGSTTN